ncbi:MAG TPA: alpha/beta hydrolase [Pseudobacteroides sp.]|nr:alpha/beta hydrolase [Pseudobacteroides sp.]
MSDEIRYEQFVDSSEPLSSMQEKDWTFYGQCSESYTYLYDIHDPNRQDYLDIPYGEDPMQKLDIHHLKSDDDKLRPVIFFIHGGGWTSEDKSNTRFFAQEWIKNGYTVVSTNYRLAPNVNHPSQIEDCSMAFKWTLDNIKDYGGDPDNIAVIGHSAGAHLAALLVISEKWHKKYNIDIKKVKCWIPVSGVFDFNLPENYIPEILNLSINAMLGNSDKNDCSPILHVTGNEPPCLILHGGDDWLVPRSNSINLHTELVKKGCKNAELNIVPGYWHVNMMLGYDQKGHKPAEIINSYLAKMLPTSI